MNACLFSTIQSAAYCNRFECSTQEEHSDEIIFGSMQHMNHVGVYDDGDALLMISMLNGDGVKLYGLNSGMCLSHPPTAKQEVYLAYHRVNVYQEF